MRMLFQWTALTLMLQLGVFSSALAINSLPPGTASSGAIPIGNSASEAPPDQWSFVPFSDTSCADPGTTAGIDFYPSSTANKDHLLIYFQAGGYCYDYDTCYNMRAGETAPGFISLVVNLHGFTPGYPAGGTAIVNNSAAYGNPFADWSKVFVWYCTGDFHTGNNTATYKDPSGNNHAINHVGYANMQKYMSRLKATFCVNSGCPMPAPSRIVVAGSSAGGYGAVWNLQQIISKFGITSSHVQLVDDVGPYMRTPYWTSILQAKMALSWWGTRTNTIPRACANAGYNCDARTGGEFNAVLGDLQIWFPSLRASLITASADAVIASAFSRLTYGPPDNQPPYAPGSCGSAWAGDCLPDGYEGLAIHPTQKLHGYFCTEALPDYTGNQPPGFKTFEITTPQVISSGVTYLPTHHEWLAISQLNQIHALDGTLLSDFLFDQLSGTGPAWADHIYTSSEASSTCSGYSF